MILQLLQDSASALLLLQAHMALALARQQLVPGNASSEEAVVQASLDLHRLTYGKEALEAFTATKHQLPATGAGAATATATWPVSYSAGQGKTAQSLISPYFARYIIFVCTTCQKLACSL